MLTLALLSKVTLTTLIAFRKLAPSIGLLDKPNERKLHTGQIPLVGGISICTALVLYLAHFHLIPDTHIYAVCIAFLTGVGALDDKHDLSFKFRLVIQASLSAVMMLYADLILVDLGNIFGFGEVNLGYFGYLITALAVIGAINAFNMVDGLDGLVGCLSIITFSSLGILFIANGYKDIALFCFALVAAIIPYLLFNMGLFKEKRKVFMGDAGSMMIGFTVIWVLLLGSQNTETKSFNAATALWVIALPLMDMVATMLRRVIDGKSPFHPDRGHYHHALQDYGFNKRKTVLIMTLQAGCHATIGVTSELFGISEAVMFYGILLMFCFHLCILHHLRKNKKSKCEPSEVGLPSKNRQL